MSAEGGAPTELVQLRVRSALDVVDECAADLARSWSRFIKSARELVAVGTLALYRAAARYREEKHRDFRVYARCCVRGAMRDALRMEQFQDRLQRAADAAVDRHLAEHREPEPDAFVHDENDARRRLRDFANGLFTATFAAGMDEVMREQGEGAAALRREYAVAIDALRRALAMLEPEESQMLLFVYGEQSTMDQLSERLGVPYIRVRRTHARALERLHKFLVVMGVTRAPPSMNVPGVGTALPANEVWPEQGGPPK